MLAKKTALNNFYWCNDSFGFFLDVSVSASTYEMFKASFTSYCFMNRFFKKRKIKKLFPKNKTY